MKQLFLFPTGLYPARFDEEMGNAMIPWTKSGDACGYDIYYGIAQDKLCNCIHVNG